MPHNHGHEDTVQTMRKLKSLEPTHIKERVSMDPDQSAPSSLCLLELTLSVWVLVLVPKPCFHQQEANKETPGKLRRAVLKSPRTVPQGRSSVSALGSSEDGGYLSGYFGLCHLSTEVKFTPHKVTT